VTSRDECTAQAGTGSVELIRFVDCPQLS